MTHAATSVILRAEAALVRGIAVLLGLGLVAMVAVNVANAAGRYSGAFSLTGADELLVYGMIWITMLGAVLAARDRDHLSVNLLPAALSGRGAIALRMAIDIITVAVCAFIAWHSYDFVAKIAAFGQTSMALGMPMVIPHMAILIGFAGMACVTAVLIAADVSRALRAGGRINGRGAA